MPFTFAQPIDLGEVIPPVQSSSKGGAKAPPPVKQFNFLKVRDSVQQWTLEQGKEEIRAILLATNDINDIPEDLTLGAIANALFRENRGGSEWSMFKRGVPVYRPRLEDAVEAILQHANCFGQHFVTEQMLRDDD